MFWEAGEETLLSNSYIDKKFIDTTYWQKNYWHIYWHPLLPLNSDSMSFQSLVYRHIMIIWAKIEKRKLSWLSCDVLSLNEWTERTEPGLFHLPSLAKLFKKWILSNSLLKLKVRLRGKPLLQVVFGNSLESGWPLAGPLLRHPLLPAHPGQVPQGDPDHGPIWEQVL